jgi:Spy/CpxP family protein refolding chaperone
MKKRYLMILVCLGIVFIFSLALWSTPEAQTPPGGPGDGGPNMMNTFRDQMMVTQALPIDSSWTILSFGMELSDDALIKARKLYQEAWNQRKEKILDKMDEARGDPEAMKGLRTESEKMWTNLRTKINEILTPEQLEKFSKWEKDNKNQARMMPGGPRGGNRPE